MVHVPDSPVTFGGGFARGIRRNRELGQEDRALDISEDRNRILREQAEQQAEEFRVEQERLKKKAEAERRSALISDVNTTQKAAFDFLAENPRLTKDPTTVSMFEQGVETLGEALRSSGSDPDMMKAFNERTAWQRHIIRQLSSEDPVEVRDAENKLKALKALEEGTGDKAEARAIAGIGGTRSLLFVHRETGHQVPVDPLSLKDQENLISAGYVPVPGGVSIQAGSLSEIETPLTQSQQGLQRQEETRSALGITQLSALLGKLQRLGAGATGIRGITGEIVGGVFSQLNETLGSIVTEGITGVSEEELESFRVESRAALARSIETFTSEEGSRVSDKEREITDQALRLLRPEASFVQIKSAAQLAMKLSFLARDRNIFLQGLPYQFDLNTDEGALAQIQQLRKLGLNEDFIAETILDQMTLRDLMASQESPVE